MSCELALGNHVIGSALSSPALQCSVIRLFEEVPSNRRAGIVKTSPDLGTQRISGSTVLNCIGNHEGWG